MLQAISNTPATITLTSTLNGQPASPGQEVTYTCTLTDAATLSWTAPPVFTSTSLVRFAPNDSSTEKMLNCSNVSDINCTDINFQAALTSVGQIDMNGSADLNSTFRFPATVTLNGTVVQCSGSTRTGEKMANQTLIVEGMYFAMVYLCNLPFIRVSYRNLCWGGQWLLKYGSLGQSGSMLLQEFWGVLHCLIAIKGFLSMSKYWAGVAYRKHHFTTSGV